MYDDLVRLLKNCSSDTVEDCVGCPYQGGYKGTYCMNGLISEAADAIEELQSDNSSLNGTVSNLIQQIAELSKPRWIPVTERLPKMYQPVLTFDGQFHAVEMRVPYILDGDGNQIESDWWVEADNDINAEYYRGLRDGAVDYWTLLPEPPKEVDT